MAGQIEIKIPDGAGAPAMPSILPERILHRTASPVFLVTQGDEKIRNFSYPINGQLCFRVLALRMLPDA
jgi:hypothetical protein